MRGVALQGRSVIVAMCVGQLGSLLPHVVVPALLAGFLIPEWHLSGAQAGLLAGSGAAGASPADRSRGGRCPGAIDRRRPWPGARHAGKRTDAPQGRGSGRG